MSTLPSTVGFDALLLAGGASSRMGRDKALLPLGNGLLLWQRQLEVLQTLRPGRVFISGPEREGFPNNILPDQKPGLGPLGGIVEGLRATEQPLLVVLAIDLPGMTSAYLASLLAHCDRGHGCVPKRGKWFEPLAAVYPRAALELAETALGSADRSLQSLLARLLVDDLMRVKMADDVPALFDNWNEPR